MVSCYNVQEKGGFLLPLDELLFPRTGSQPLGPTIYGEIYKNIVWDIYTNKVRYTHNKVD